MILLVVTVELKGWCSFQLVLVKEGLVLLLAGAGKVGVVAPFS